MQEQKEDEESLGLLDFDSEDIKNAIELYYFQNTCFDLSMSSGFAARSDMLFSTFSSG